jgi:hypothetical protein
MTAVVVALPAVAPRARQPRAARSEKTARLCLVGLSWLPSLAAQATPATGVDAQMRAVLDRLDAAFARGDVAGYAAAFAPDHPGAHALLLRHLEHCFGGTDRRHRETTVVGAPRRVGDHTALRLRHDLALHGDASALLPRTTFTEEWLLALRPDGAGGWVPTLAVETMPSAACVGDELFRCPPCNYEVGGVEGWLCVPLRADRANALEAVSFYLLGTDVACDVSVQVDAACTDAAETARQLAATLLRLEPTAKAEPPVPWTPPAHRREPPAGLHGAVVALDLPHDFAGDGGRALLHVAVFGGLQHLLLVRGSARELRERAPAVDALLASYRLLERRADSALAASRALAHHTGGDVDGATYRNARYGVVLAGEPGWRPALRTGGAAFRVVWTSARGSRLWLTGYAVPPGLQRWCRATATRWVESQCERGGLQLALAHAGDAAAWRDDAPCGGSSRTLLAVPRANAPAQSAPQRRLRIVVRDDLLLVLDGHAVDDADDAALQRMQHALTR